VAEHVLHRRGVAEVIADATDQANEVRKVINFLPRFFLRLTGRDSTLVPIRSWKLTAGMLPEKLSRKGVTWGGGIRGVDSAAAGVEAEPARPEGCGQPLQRGCKSNVRHSVYSSAVDQVYLSQRRQNQAKRPTEEIGADTVASRGHLVFLLRLAARDRRGSACLLLLHRSQPRLLHHSVQWLLDPPMTADGVSRRSLPIRAMAHWAGTSSSRLRNRPPRMGGAPRHVIRACRYRGSGVAPQ